MITTTTPEIDYSVRFLDDLVGRLSLKRTAFRLWDGTLWPDERPREATVVLKHRGALREMFGAGTEQALAEAYLSDAFDIDGDIESAFELADILLEKKAGAMAHIAAKCLQPEQSASQAGSYG